ncbi:MAG: immunity protein YezG family protein [Bacillota bacterium]
MNEKIESLYSQIAQKAIELIPTKWSKVLLYAEILPGVVTEVHYFIEEDTGKAIQFGDIPTTYQIERSEFNRKSLGLTKLIRQMNKEFVDCNQKMWTAMTFVLSSDGEFKIDYGYDNIEETDITIRRQQWEKKYLGL